MSRPTTSTTSRSPTAVTFSPAAAKQNQTYNSSGVGASMAGSNYGNVINSPKGREFQNNATVYYDDVIQLHLSRCCRHKRNRPRQVPHALLSHLRLEFNLLTTFPRIILMILEILMEIIRAVLAGNLRNKVLRKASVPSQLVKILSTMWEALVEAVINFPPTCPPPPLVQYPAGEFSWKIVLLYNILSLYFCDMYSRCGRNFNEDRIDKHEAACPGVKRELPAKAAPPPKVSSIYNCHASVLKIAGCRSSKERQKFQVEDAAPTISGRNQIREKNERNYRCWR